MAAVEITLAVRSATEHMVLVASLPAAGAGFVLVGTLAWSRRPSNRTGLLLSVAGLLVLGASLLDVHLPGPLRGVGTFLGEAPIAATLHVVLAFPSGRVPTSRGYGLRARHISNIYAELGLPDGTDSHRRVLAVLRYLAR